MSDIKSISAFYNEYCRPSEKNWYHFPLLAVETNNNFTVDDWDFADLLVNVLIATHDGVVEARRMWVEGDNDETQPKAYLYARAALYLARTYQEKLDLVWAEYQEDNDFPQNYYDKIKDIKEDLISNIILMYCW